MNQFLSVFLAIAVMLSGFGGMISPSGDPVSVEISLGAAIDPAMLSSVIPSTDADASGEAASAAPTADSIAEMIQKLTAALSLRIAAEKDAGEFQILLNGEPAATVASRKAADGSVEVVSSLLPTTKLTVSAETMNMLASSMNPVNALGSVDTAALTAAVTDALNALLADIAEKTGEPETGSFSVHGGEYTVKTPLNITTKELALAVLNCAKTILANETVASALTQVEAKVSADSLDETIANLESQDEAEMPVTAAAVYTNEAGDSCMDFELTKDDQNVDVAVINAADITTVYVAAMNQLELSLVVDPTASSMILEGSFDANGQTANLSLSLSELEGQSVLHLTVAYGAAENPSVTLQISGTVTPGKGVTAAFDAETLKPVAFESLMSADENSEEAAALGQEFQTGIMTALMSLISVVPEAASLLGTMSSPAAQ